MRSKLAAKNMIANIVLQLVVFLSGIAMPRFFLQEYGSNINGMVTSITQFLVYLGLAEAGVGTASVVALYGPLANDDQDGINGILSATRRFYNRSGIIFSILVLGFAFIYPFLLTEQLNSSMVRMMVLILASSTVVDYVFLGKYKVLLTANQKGYVVAYVQAIGTIVNVGISLLLIYLHCSPLIVKGVATFAYILRFFLVKWYVMKHYKKISYHAEPKMEGLNQRGAALLHQVVGVIVNNTAVVLLTVCMGAKSLIEVSVYGIYNMIVTAINQMLTSFSNGLTAGFGEVISKDEQDVLRDSFSHFEYVFMMVLSCVVACMGVLILPFVAVYTENVSDANYIRALSAILFTIIVYLQNIRIPGLTIISAAGHFRETRKQAILEAGINLLVSVVLIWKMGMNGVLIGTIFSYGYRSLDIILYNRKYLVKGSGKQTFIRILRNLVVTIFIIAGCMLFVPQKMESFISWFVYAMVTGCISFILVVFVNFVFEPEEFKGALRRFSFLNKFVKL